MKITIGFCPIPFATLHVPLTTCCWTWEQLLVCYERRLTDRVSEPSCTGLTLQDFGSGVGLREQSPALPCVRAQQLQLLQQGPTTAGAEPQAMLGVLWESRVLISIHEPFFHYIFSLSFWWMGWESSMMELSCPPLGNHHTPKDSLNCSVLIIMAWWQQVLTSFYSTRLSYVMETINAPPYSLVDYEDGYTATA